MADELLMNIVKKIGHRMDSCGTPKETGSLDDLLLQILTDCVLVDREFLNQ